MDANAIEYFSRLLGSPMKKTSFVEQNKLAALQMKGLVVLKYIAAAVIATAQLWLWCTW
ncbi:PREDICTED: uncharacterized protein LOC109130531 [Camelina sativa]|uniref:Uncharacterized protein LOC109130531 n=1 Tax=Camelina sativa TaxID=90675 RepID=A0ABM1R9K7_CAMSA|nr:PREDICTED: uncharacterized protein LOC109130531 [Camelina sativa]